MLSARQQEAVSRALDTFLIELPSWAFANTGTRFGKFVQDAAAATIEEKLSDAGQVHAVTGCCPTVAVHVGWDFSNGRASASEVAALAAKSGVRIGAINPTVFEQQEYKYGSLGNPNAAIRRLALDHILECIEIGKETGSRYISLWFADGSNYPGTAGIRQRKRWFTEGLAEAHSQLADGQILLVEYKPFEPAFYHTDIADWGMAFLYAKAAGPQARVLVDTGHHYQAQNIEQIVAWLLDEGMLGGFHLNDRRYADDDLTLGSIDPYQVFRIFHEIAMYEWETGKPADIAYMIDQSHNLKPKIEEMIQTVQNAQELWAKAMLVDHERLTAHQRKNDLVDAEECLRDAFSTDVRPAIREWRISKGLPGDPLTAFRESGYLQAAAAERAGRGTVAASYSGD
jgi:L-rhamnose isomerase/sugar isomerase